jgi:hypothetical protein
MAEALYEAAVARAARIGHDDLVERALLGSAAGHPDFQHWTVFPSVIR